MRDRALLIVVAIALVMRLVTVAGTPDYKPSGDPADYDRHAVALSQTGSFAPTQLAEPNSPSALRPPLYPLVLAGVYEVTGARWTPARILGALLGTTAVALIFLLAAALFDRSTAKWAAGVAAIYPPLVGLSAGLSAENLFIPWPSARSWRSCAPTGPARGSGRRPPAG
jgi:4-amino-4-deoxy-L-arabinose transferase-like glycosyltransferase